MANFRQSSVWKISKQIAFDPVRRTTARLFGVGRVPVEWCVGRNWGDALSPVLVSLLAGKSVAHVNGQHNYRYLVIGSILESANEYSEVWGAGFISEKGLVKSRPKAVYAVRGPLSRNLLLNEGIECPEIYGDPALLLPRFFNPTVQKRYDIGIIPHYIDKQSKWLDLYRDDPSVLILDIQSGIQDFVRAVKSCKAILSSSLHGLICADAYHIPNAWVQFSDRILGGEFKFRDYRLGIGSPEPQPLRVAEKTPLAVLLEKTQIRPLNVDLRKLILACPFLSEYVRREVIDAELALGGLPQRFISSRLKDYQVAPNLPSSNSSHLNI